MSYISKFANFNALLTGVTIALFGASLWLIFVWVPTDANQGAVQRIFYLHVPVAWVCMLAIFVVALGSLIYLIRGGQRWDRLAHSAAETGLVFGTLMLISGILWARPIWGQWWTGEAQLTTALILYLIYIGYLALRAFLPPGVARNRLSAVVALSGAALSPVIYFAAELWEAAHPQAVIGPLAEESASLSPEFRTALYVSLAATLALMALVTKLRYQLRDAEDELDEAYRDAELTLARR